MKPIEIYIKYLKYCLKNKIKVHHNTLKRIYDFIVLNDVKYNTLNYLYAKAKWMVPNENKLSTIEKF